MESFKELSLPEELEKALSKLQFVKPTKTQEAVIPMVFEGRDVMACAETGSGKTAAYGIPMVTQLLEDNQRRALVLAPTRELAQQISDFLRELTAFCDHLNVISIVGGADIRKQLKGLKKKPQIVVATPGRLTDHLKRRSINLRSTDILVLDEGDRMLDMGFAPQLDVILEYVPKERQTSLFSATLNDKVRKLANKYLNSPKSVNVGRSSMPVSKIKQSIIQVKNKEKDERVVDELNQREGSVIIFSKTKRRTSELAKHLLGYGFRVDLIHGGRTQGQRNMAIRNFKKGKSRILCATDVAARGIDVPQVEHVINFDLPMFNEDYVHRIGRTARNGASGEAVSFVTPNDHKMWNSLVRKYSISGLELKGSGKSESAGGNRRGQPRKKKSSGRPGGFKKRSSKKSSKSKPNHRGRR